MCGIGALRKDWCNRKNMGTVIYTFLNDSIGDVFCSFLMLGTEWNKNGTVWTVEKHVSDKFEVH